MRRWRSGPCRSSIRPISERSTKMIAKRIAAALFAAALLGPAPALWAAPGQTVVFKLANQGDALSMDPHSLNESLQLSLLSNIYEPLVTLDKNLKFVPALATDWKQTSPTMWRFNLRHGVTFHDGTPFTADDVIFSYERAGAAGSDVTTYVGRVKEIRKINDYAVD